MGATSATVLVLLLCGCSAQVVPTVSVTSLHANQGAGTDTNMDEVTWYVSSYRSATIGSTYVFQIWNQPASGTVAHLFSPTATGSNRVMGLFSGGGLIYTRSSLLHLRKTLYLAGTGGEDRLQVHTLSYDASTNTYGQVAVPTFSEDIQDVTMMTSDQEASGYVYYLESKSGIYTMRKWDTNLPTRDPAGVQVTSNRCQSLQMLGPTVIFFGDGVNLIRLIEKSAFVLFAEYTGAVDSRYFTLDNQNPAILFTTTEAAPHGVGRILLGTSTYVQTHAIPPVAGQTDPEYAAVINLGNMAYIGLIRYHETNLPFRIYAKADLTNIDTGHYSPLSSNTGLLIIWSLAR